MTSRSISAYTLRRFAVFLQLCPEQNVCELQVAWVNGCVNERWHEAGDVQTLSQPMQANVKHSTTEEE